MANDLARGALLLLIGECLLAVMAASIKHLSQEVPQEILVFTRNLFGLVFLVPIIAHHGFHSLKTSRLPLHMMRALVGVTAMYCYFYVIANLPLAEAALVKLSSPFFLPIIALLWLGAHKSKNVMGNSDWLFGRGVCIEAGVRHFSGGGSGGHSGRCLSQPGESHHT